MNQLTLLYLGSCGLLDIRQLKYLANLKEISLFDNYDIDITPLQYLTQLEIIDLSKCNLKCIDILGLLVYLKDLSIEENAIIYTQPLIQLKELSRLSALNNQIIDIQTLKRHPNFEKYKILNQQQPTNQEIVFANILRDINTPNTSLKLMPQNRKTIQSKIEHQQHKINMCLAVLFNRQATFIGLVASLCQNLNESIDRQ
ncbi:Conserved_hypothetical protein [Hexamita inflata]|uniref:Uncharacterized protein n=1 Tax=Hexamita inflata TaxID=28002 RepID=A0AA86V1U0_9EUKA|nr:Conserved hypothetical protein [Hexamita inflata]